MPVMRMHLCLAGRADRCSRARTEPQAGPRRGVTLRASDPRLPIGPCSPLRRRQAIRRRFRRLSLVVLIPREVKGVPVTNAPPPLAAIVPRRRNNGGLVATQPLSGDTVVIAARY